MGYLVDIVEFGIGKFTEDYDLIRFVQNIFFNFFVPKALNAILDPWEETMRVAIA